MSKFLFLGLFSAFFSFSAYSLVNDGCYQMFVPGSLFPVICLSGTMEEGIGGSGVRTVLVGPNSTNVAWCASTQSTEVLEDGATRFIYSETTGMRKITMKDGANGGPGAITLEEIEGNGTHNLQYLKLSDSSLVLEQAFNDPKCQ